MIRRLLISLGLGIAHSLSAAIIVQGNDTNVPYAFKTPILSQTYDRGSGMFFVGLEAGTGSVTNGFYSISKASRPSFNATPQFSPVITETDPLMLENSSIEFLSFSSQPVYPTLIGVQLNGTIQSATKLFGIYTDGSSQAQTDDLNDAAGSTTNGIVAVTASTNYAFAAVAANGTHWGDTNSGIALVGIDTDSAALELSIKNAPAGIDGNLAVALANGSAELGTDTIITNTHVALTWDDTLQRLFIGLSVQAGANASDVVKSVVVGRIENGALLLQEIAPNGAASASTDNIVLTEGANATITTKHIAVMHTSTGPDYLIVDCFASTSLASAGCNRVFALPLVNDTQNATSSTNGTLAEFDSTLSDDKKFTDAATANANLLQNNATTYPQAVVGAGNLPIKSDDQISDLVVVGDGVYVCIDDNDGASVEDSDRGIFYSQAMFDGAGKIARWTPWTKRVIPFNAFGSTELPGGATHNGAVKFLEVDGKTGNVWFVEGTTEKTVGITSWTKGSTTNGLMQTLNTKLPQGVYSVLDLDQATNGFFQTTVHRYALFGGVNKVAFARVNQAFDAGDAASDQTYSSSPQTIITDYSTEENFKVVNLPEKAGCCQVLEYSRTNTSGDSMNRENINYFFAGTSNGLYVFNVNGHGFNAHDLALINATPFSDGVWTKIESITGDIIDIKTSGAGETLYVIANESTTAHPLQSTLYSIPFESTIAAMFASSNIRTIAQTGVGIFDNVLKFYGIEIIATGAPDSINAIDQEQLVLTTNQGLYRSDAEQTSMAPIKNGVSDAINQTETDWKLVAYTDSFGNVSTTQTTMFNGIAGPNTPIRQTTWPFNLKDKANFSIFDRGNINQFSGCGTTFNDFFIPTLFNADSSADAFKTLDRIVYFYSDGGRRFFIYNRTQDPPTQFKIGVLPYNVSEWNIAQPGILANPTLETVNRFYWISPIGATGLLLAGTQTGVVGLE